MSKWCKLIILGVKDLLFLPQVCMLNSSPMHLRLNWVRITKINKLYQMDMYTGLPGMHATVRVSWQHTDAWLTVSSVH